MNSIFYDTSGGIVRTGEQLGAGGEGIVYEVQGRRELAAKIYHEQLGSEKAEKLLALSHLGSGRLFKLSAWPMDVLRARPEGEVIGFLMKRINEGREVHTLHSPKSRLQSFPEASWAFLIYVAANIVRAITNVHEHGFVIGDVNPKNILVTRKATVFLLDCDSFQVSAGGKTYRCEGGFPEYTPPELQGKAFGEVDRRAEHDYFGLAVAVFQLLFLGRHPFSGLYLGGEEMTLERAIREYRFAYGDDAETRQMKPPPGALSLDAMPGQIVDLFRRAFLSPSVDERPGPIEWIGPLESLAKSLKKCSLHSGHDYYRELHECPWCTIETGARIRLFNFPLNGNGAKHGHFKLDEVWQAISSINPPPPPPMVRTIPPESVNPSSLGEKVVRERREDMTLAIVVAVVAGFIIGLTTGWLLLLCLAGVGVIKLARGSTLLSMQFSNKKSLSAVAETIQKTFLETDAHVRKLELEWKEEAGEERFVNKFIELQNQKETYEKLPQIRQFRLNSLATKGHGVTTRARIAVEKEVDDLRYRLEHELSAGAFYLSRIKSEIETSRERLLKVYLNEKLSLAQATKDWEVATMQNGITLALVLLVVSFFIGTFFRATPMQTRRPVPTETLIRAPENSVVQHDASVTTGESAVKVTTLPSATSKKAKDLYDQGVLLVDEKKFEEASIKLANAVKIDPRVREAWEQLGFAQYRLGHYTQSLDAENRAVSLGESFTSLYTMGLVHFALKDWVKARESLSNAVHYCDATAWNDSCAEAYEDLARSIFELADAKYTIESLEQRGAGKLPDQERFMLAVLYLQIGDTSAATQHYQILKGSSPMMAQELGRLLGVGKPPSLQKKPESIFEFSLKAPVRGTPNASWSAGAV